LTAISGFRLSKI